MKITQNQYIFLAILLLLFVGWNLAEGSYVAYTSQSLFRNQTQYEGFEDDTPSKPDDKQTNAIKPGASKPGASKPGANAGGLKKPSASKKPSPKKPTVPNKPAPKKPVGAKKPDPKKTAVLRNKYDPKNANTRARNEASNLVKNAAKKNIPSLGNLLNPASKKKEGFTDFYPVNDPPAKILDVFSGLSASKTCKPSGFSNAQGFLCLSEEAIQMLTTRGGNAH